MGGFGSAAAGQPGDGISSATVVDTPVAK